MLAAEPMTAARLARALPEIATATLYRHLKTLVDSGLVRLEYRDHGRPAPAEGIYSYDDRAGTFTGEAFAGASVDDLRRYFGIFVAAALGDFERYLGASHVDVLEDLVVFNRVTVRLSRERRKELLTALNRLVQSYAQTPDDDAEAAIITQIAIPSQPPP